MSFTPQQNHDEGHYQHPPNQVSILGPYEPVAINQYSRLLNLREVTENPYQQQFVLQSSNRNIYNAGETDAVSTAVTTAANQNNNCHVGSRNAINEGRRKGHRIKPGESIMALDRHPCPLPPPPPLCLLTYMPHNPFDFNRQEKNSIAKRLFEDVIASEPRDTLFHNQSLLILKNNSMKSGLNKIDHRCISCADEVFMFQRNPLGQIYFMKDLHLHVHFTISQVQRQVVEFLCAEKGGLVDIQPTENIVREHYAIWNKDDWDGQGGHKFLSDTSELIEKIFPGFQGMMKIPQKGDNRGTIAANIGLTVNDCTQYGQNRSTIFGNIRPYLIKLDCKDDCALKSLGKLAIYTFKHILPRFGQHQHFHLPTETKAGAARFQLRRDFAKSLFVDEEEDVSYFLVEAISIIIPIIVYPHRDSSNDTVENQSGTVTINCSLNTNIITNNNLKTYLQNLGYIETFPCSVIFYSRACCGTYFRRIEDLGALEKKNPIGKAIVSSIEILQDRNEKDYVGRIFDNTEYLASIIRNMEERISKEHIGTSKTTHNEQLTHEQNEMSKGSCPVTASPCNCFRALGSSSREGMSCSRSIHINNIADIVPFSYDVMSKWSIVIDCALEIHFQLKPLTVEITLLFIICIVVGGVDGMICMIHQELSSEVIYDNNETRGEEGFIHLVNAMKRLLSRKCGFSKTDITALLEDVMERLHSTRSQIISVKKNNAIMKKTISESCDELLRGLLYDSGYTSFLQLKIQEGKDFIYLAALFGLLPLGCVAWATVHPFDKVSEKMKKLNSAKDSLTSQDLFNHTYSYLIKKVSVQTTGSLLQNILLSHDGDHLQPHYYYYHPHRNAIQHFYRVKKEAQWELQMLSRSPFEWKSCRSRMTSVTTWNSKDDLMNWLLIDNRITCKSSLVVPNEFKHIFFSKFEMKCQHIKRRRIE